MGHYEVECELGRGGGGVVYLARDPALERRVAIKVLPDDLARDPERLARFRREAKLLASLQHPNVAAVYGFEEEDVHFLVMEYVEGETLETMLRDGPLSVERAVEVVRQIALAIESAHARSVIHRDLKPANVRVSPEGVVKVLDFGLARPVAAPAGTPAGDDPTEVSGPTIHGQIMGTPGYMSPEQACGGPVDTPADLWAFGCVLYECLTCRRAFPAANASAAAAAVLTAEPEWERLPATTPAGIRALLERCFEKDPRRRLADMREARSMLERARGEQPTIWASASVERACPHNVPAQVSSFVGRRRELEELHELLGRSRLVTLAGAGGCGKTRLALELAGRLTRGSRFPSGIWYVELAPLADGALALPALAAALGLKDEPGRTLRETVTARLQGHAALVILDNCEHLAAACAELGHALLSACRELKVIATSREPLGISGETIFRVPSLSFPPIDVAEDAAVILASESAQLFVERARALNPAFRLDAGETACLADICRRLDGIPLAIELAAARTRALPVEEIARRLHASFRLLTGGSKAALPRHQTLRATFDWSYGLLAGPEQTLLRRLSVFVGGWTLEAAEQVCAGPATQEEAEVLDLLEALVDKSIVSYEERARSGSRYQFLETMRQYAREELNKAGETEALRDRHADYFVGFAEAAEPGLRGPEQARWFARVESDRDNLLAAVRWCGGSEAGAPAGLRLAGALWQFWSAHGHLGLGRSVLEEILSRPGADTPTRERAKALSAAGTLAKQQGDFAAAQRLHTESLRIRSTLGDDQGKAGSLNNLALIARAQGDLVTARDLQTQSLELYRRIGDEWGVSVMLGNLGDVALVQGDLDLARELLDESLTMRRKLGDTQGMAHALCNLVSASIRQGNHDGARRELAECLGLVRTIEDKNNGAYALEAAGELAADTGDPKRALVILAAAGRLREDVGSALPPVERAERDALLERLRETLGGEAAAQAAAEGRALSFEDASALALQPVG